MAKRPIPLQRCGEWCLRLKLHKIAGIKEFKGLKSLKGLKGLGGRLGFNEEGDLTNITCWGVRAAAARNANLRATVVPPTEGPQAGKAENWS